MGRNRGGKDVAFKLYVLLNSNRAPRALMGWHAVEMKREDLMK